MTTATTIDLKTFAVAFHTSVEQATAHAEEHDQFLVTKADDLLELTGSQQVALFNATAKAIGGQPVKRFATKRDAVRRIMANLRGLFDAQTAPAAKKERKTRVMWFNFAPTNEIKTLRDTDTLRGRCVALLTEGGTFEQVEDLVREFDERAGKESKNVTRRAYELVRIMHYYLGYGIRHDLETGIIKLTTTK